VRHISDTKMIGIHKKVSFQVKFGLQSYIYLYIYIHIYIYTHYARYGAPMSDLNVGHFFKPRCEVAILWGHICIQCHLVFYCGVFKICEAYQMPPISDTKNDRYTQESLISGEIWIARYIYINMKREC